MNKITAMLLSGAAVAVLSSGCASSAKIGWDRPSSLQPNGRTAVVEDAKFGGNRDVVGRNTFTLFAIPTFGIKADRPVDRSVTLGVEDAVQAAGYTLAQSGASEEAITVSTDIKKFYYSNYTWFWPVMINNGKIEMQVKARNPSGKVFMDRGYSAKSSWISFGSSSGFSDEIRGEMSDILRDLRDDLSRATP